MTTKIKAVEQEQICSEPAVEKCLARRVLCICNVILEHALFQDIKRKETHKLTEIADIVDLSKNQKLFFCGQKLDSVYFVLKGALRLYRNSVNSDKSFLSSISKKGDAVALETLFQNRDTVNYSVDALEDSTILLLDRGKLRGIIDQNPIIKANLLNYLSNQVYELNDSCYSLALTEVSERLMIFLKQESLKANAQSFDLEISKTDLAAMLATVPATLSRVMAKLSEEGQISVDGSLINLLK